jgi:hypothetical protein
LVATPLAIWLRVATPLSEIAVGIVAQLVIGALTSGDVLGTDESWIKLLSGAGAIVLTFLAGAELDPVVFCATWKQAGAVGLISFAVSFLGCATRRRNELTSPRWCRRKARASGMHAMIVCCCSKRVRNCCGWPLGSHLKRWAAAKVVTRDINSAWTCCWILHASSRR